MSPPTFKQLLFLISVVPNLAVANPFSCKINAEENKKSEKMIEVLIYKGYAIRDDQGIAVIQYHNDQYALKAGEKLGNYTIVDITPNRVIYKDGHLIYKSAIEDDHPSPQ